MSIKVTRDVSHHYSTILNMISLADNKKGINTFQRCSIENQKGAITIDFVQL